MIDLEQIRARNQARARLISLIKSRRDEVVIHSISDSGASPTWTYSTIGFKTRYGIVRGC